MSTEEQYNHGALLDALMGKLGMHTDAALARVLDVAPASISNIRHHRLPVGATLLVRASEVTGIKVRDLRALMGDRREKFLAAGVGNGWATKREVAA